MYDSTPFLSSLVVSVAATGDVSVRDNVWKEIAEVLKQPVEGCKSRWKNIRDTFMRQKRINKLPTGSARTKILRKWHLEEQLAFLTHVECERKSLTNIATVETQGYYDSQQKEYAVMEGDLDHPEIEATGTSTENKIVEADIVDSSIAECISRENSEDGVDEEGKSIKKSKTTRGQYCRIIKEKFF
ncbi:hypothetical protein J437_LFUL006757 [Ladona fulva]|uniref:MADF domain-containing protein n=1 Tax=Ladona fulva TaxID=123851 RepID=A0A8K0NZ16_LADFU|nr:hypothetical protein J437_LFUL006757 [Ladona fulva]